MNDSIMLVADSGSTKADWLSISAGNVTGSYASRGFNPFFHDYRFIQEELGSNAALSAIREKVERLYFFGAGCSSPERNAIIHDGLSRFFNHATIVVEHDMLGTALAVCEGKPGLACILGTGSNTCFFDGTKLLPIRHGLGYILGDEGSGSWFGRRLLAWYIYGILPEDLARAFSQKYQTGKENAIQAVYHGKDPNVYLASFAPFLSEFRNHPMIEKLVQKGIVEFFETNVKSYPQCYSNPVHFVGSIAWNFKDTIEAVAKENGIQTGNIIQKPVHGLAEYFMNGGQMP